MPIRKISQTSVVIIGSGFNGLAAAIRLRAAGIQRLAVFESADGIGGTWWHNTYPGAEVDTPSVLYSFSFAPWNWSRTHVRQQELQHYLSVVADRFGITPLVRFGTFIDRVVWDDQLLQYAVFSGEELVAHADYVVSAVGMLSDPLYPDWPGLDEFRGPVFHTSRWEHEHDLVGKRIAVTGSGSTATQVVPALAEIADKVVMFQREPGWIVPKSDRDFTPEERQALDSAIAQRIARRLMLMRRETSLLGGRVWRVGHSLHKGAEQVARNHIVSNLGSRPDLVEKVTPTYPYGGKRIVISDGFYPSLLRDNVELVPRAVERLSATGVIDVDGQEHPVDAVVLSTGFKVKFLSSLQVIGPGGADLHTFWRGDPWGLLGIMVPSFPNFFMMYGPNTNGGAIVTNAELQAKYVTAAIKYAQHRRASTIEVRDSSARLFDRCVQRLMRGTTFEYQNNYYKGESGRITTQWPDGLFVYGLLTKLLRGPIWKLGYQTGRLATAGATSPAQVTHAGRTNR